MAKDFTGRKLIVVGGSSGMGRQIAADVVDGGGGAVVIGSRPERVKKTVTELAARGPAWGITADLRDPAAAERVREELAATHDDATLLVNAAGVFAPCTPSPSTWPWNWPPTRSGSTPSPRPWWPP